MVLHLWKEDTIEGAFVPARVLKPWEKKEEGEEGEDEERRKNERMIED